MLEKLTETYDKAEYLHCLFDHACTELLLYVCFFFVSLERSKALLEKSKYSGTDTDLKRAEDAVNRKKEQKAAERIQTEETKVTVLMKKLQQTKK